MKWHFGVKRPIYLLDASLVIESDLKELSKLIGIGYSQSFLIIEKGEASYYSPKNEVKKQVKRLITNLNKTKKTLADFPCYKSRLKEALKQLIRDIDNKKYSSSSFKKFFNIYRQFITWRVLTRILGYQENLPKSFLKKVGQLRMDYKNEWTRVRESLDKIWFKIARHHKVPKEAIKSLTTKEFLNSLSKSKFNPKVIERTKKKLVLYRNRSLEHILTGRRAEKFIKDTIGKVKIEKVDIIKGQIACLGSAQGVVKIISKPKKLKLKRKFVLVTSMTTPAFVPILKYVTAIVTDEGGLTCHAAIISRELKIPCIIGTKIATKVLKDGNRVQVDANKGIIKKLR